MATLALVAGRAHAAAQCSPAEVFFTAKAASARAKCIAHRQGAWGVCATTLGSPCSGQFVPDVAALVAWDGVGALAPGDRTTYRAQLSCQRTIGVATAAYVRTRLRLVARGIDETAAIAAATRRLARIDRACAVTAETLTSGAVVPSLGGLCAGVGTTVGVTVDVAAMRTCLTERTDPWFEPLLRQFLRPNLILIVTDDQPLGMLDGMPNVESLADVGVSFTQAASTTPLCAPSRASMLTGQYAHSHHVITNDPGLGGGVQQLDDTSTLATWLQARGYRTALMGKYINGYSPLAPYVPPGWDTWRVFSPFAYYDYDLAYDGHLVHHGSTPADYSTDVIAPMAVTFIEANDPRPFFLMFAPYGPHGPATPAPRHVGAYSGVPPWRPPNWNEADVSDKPLWVRQLPLLDAPTIDDTDALRQSMLESLLSVDEAIGGILTALRDSGKERNTFVLFVSDNGFALGEHRWVNKLCPYEECFRVPMIARYPRLGNDPRIDDHPVANIDIAPTFAALAGAAPTNPIEGTSLLPLLDGSADGWRDTLLIEQWSFSPPDLVEAWTPPQTYIEYRGNPGATEFYDLAADPYQLVNTTNDPANHDARAALAARVRELAPSWTQPIPP